MTQKFRVIVSQEVFSECYIEAESEEQAREIAYETWDLPWKECHYGDWDIASVEQAKEVA